MEPEIERIDCGEHRCLIRDMESMLEGVESPKLVPNCCIYKVPPTIREENEAAYTPTMVSIGPLHHGDIRLEAMEKLKLGYLKSYLERTNKKLEDCIGIVKEKEGYIRTCYAETILQSSNNFVKMILIDACFIIEYFLRILEPSKWRKSDPIISNTQRKNAVKIDIILLENQLPFSVLEDLFTPPSIDISSFLHMSFHIFKQYSINIRSSNSGLTFDYFRTHHLTEKVEVRHLTDLLRIFHLPSRQRLPKQKKSEIVKHLYSASKLMEAGVKLKVCENKSIIELQFEGGVLTMPKLTVSDNTKPVLLNMASLEQCLYPMETYIGDYIYLLDLLINDRKDANIFVEKGIIVCIGDIDYKLVATFTDIGTGMSIGHNADYLKLSKSLNDFYEKPVHKYKAIFIRDYLSTPWKIASFIAAIVLLSLTLIQTICSIIQLPSLK